MPGWARELPLLGAPDQVVVTAVGRTGNQSPPTVLVRYSTGDLAPPPAVTPR